MNKEITKISRRLKLKSISSYWNFLVSRTVLVIYSFISSSWGVQCVGLDHNLPFLIDCSDCIVIFFFSLIPCSLVLLQSPSVGSSRKVVWRKRGTYWVKLLRWMVNACQKKHYICPMMRRLKDLVTSLICLCQLEWFTGHLRLGSCGKFSSLFFCPLESM